MIWVILYCFLCSCEVWLFEKPEKRKQKLIRKAFTFYIITIGGWIWRLKQMSAKLSLKLSTTLFQHWTQNYSQNCSQNCPRKNSYLYLLLSMQAFIKVSKSAAPSDLPKSGVQLPSLPTPASDMPAWSVWKEASCTKLIVPIM